jgi:hypothetical protein
VDTRIFLRFDAEEDAELHALGRTFLDYFAAKISYWSSRYRPRDLSGSAIDKEGYEAIMKWQRAQGIDS